MTTTSKVLVIDDEQPTLSMFRLFLDAYGFEVHTAENGEEGLERFAETEPPIVFTDIKMPGMDGIEVLGRIKEAKPETEVIVITGHGDMDLAITALNLDAADFINKPISREALDQALTRAEERIRLAREKDRQITVDIRDDVGVVRIRGAANSRSEAAITAAVRQAEEASDRLVLSFDKNASINGAGIAILTQLLLARQQAEKPTAICGLSANFRKVVDMVGLSRLAEVVEDENRALKELAS
jgi:anti-anti-sigma factor